MQGINLLRLAQSLALAEIMTDKYGSFGLHSMLDTLPDTVEVRNLNGSYLKTRTPQLSDTAFHRREWGYWSQISI